jgi:hypothetical protein
MSELETPSHSEPVSRRRMVWAGVACGVFYGLLARIVFGAGVLKSAFFVMSVAFIFLVPFALGYAAVTLGEREGPWSWQRRLLAPWLPALLSLTAALALAWEGLICIVLWLPLFMLMSSLGGLAAGLVARWRGARGREGRLMAAVLILPFLVSPLESQVTADTQQRVVDTAIDIDAPPAMVWRHIIRVPAFQAEEHRVALSHLIGFPRPVEATLSREGVGGVRHATFERGVLFVETITAWEPERELAFSIRADPGTIPPAALDEHVTVGGPYFDVLDGRYRLEPLSTGRVRLHLSSTHRLSTHFNLYSGVWTDFVMRDVQRYILGILKERCEREAHARRLTRLTH